MLKLPQDIVGLAEEAVLIANSPEFLYKRIVNIFANNPFFSKLTPDEIQESLAEISEENLYSFKTRAVAYLLLIVALDKSSTKFEKELAPIITQLQWAKRLVKIYNSIHSSSSTVELITPTSSIQQYRNIVASSTEFQLIAEKQSDN